MRPLAALFALLFAPPAFTQPAVPATEKYAAAVAEIQKLIEEEVADKNLPALSIALIDDQQVVWAKGFGFQDRAKTIPATAETIYRVGSVSKLFTDVAVMQLVEDGKLALDEPVAKYIPDFRPKLLPEHKPITLRMLMAHRSGLIREPPVGNYFDPSQPTLSQTVASLNGIPLVYAPEERIKYSNAAIGVVGYTLQQTQNDKFESLVQKKVLDPLGMKSSSFVPTETVKKRLADAVMWTYHGREFPAPTFELGMAPAGCMYSTVLDLARFASCMLASGKISDTPILKPSTVEQMFAPQFAKPDAKSGFGIGFNIGDMDGIKEISHGGAIYGFATSWSILPTEKLGVVVVCSRDVANDVVGRISNDAFRQMIAAKAGKPLPKIVRSEPLPPEEARSLAGRYTSKDAWLELTESAGRLYLTLGRGGHRFRLRKSGDGLISDDVENFGGMKFTRDGDTLTTPAGTKWTKEKPEASPPPEPPAKWKGLIGEYGWDHNTLYIYERAGKLHALIEWTEIDPLTELAENEFAFPNQGMYPGEKLIFTRDADGRATKVEAASVVFPRRKVDGENGETFKIQPERPLAELRKAALAAKPPAEPGLFLKPDLIDLATLDGVKFDIRYATDNNFLGTPFYASAKAYMQRPAALALERVQAKVKELGYGLLVHDAYRPWHVTKMFRDATPPKFHNFVADPLKGSRHNRGCAVDLGLYDLKTGKPVEVVSGYDEFSDRAFPDYMGGTSRQRWHRDLLRRAMEAEGFTVYEEEWWHFDYKDWKKYPILNLTFEHLK
ncbi:MAG TPA: serine hydrolase [Gemmataceae bacterium]|nr:serine hydrolase [Gemmataceae bacterium]